jgi:Tfp pilus assembly protein PilV
MEAMAAGVIFLAGITGVMVLITQQSRMVRRGALNSQLAQAARDQVQQRAISRQTLGVDEIGATITIMNTYKATRDTQIFDVSSTGPTPAIQEPGCPNVGRAGAQCVQVIVRDPAMGMHFISSSYVY